MNKFVELFDRYRKPIGYTIGVLNVLTGLADVSVGHTMTGILFLIIGALIIFDTKVYK
jgi:hypothetical protein